MRYQSRMDRGFMVALLSASGFLVWRRYHVYPCWLRMRFPGKTPALLKMQSGCQRLCVTNTAWILLTAWEIRRFISAVTTSVDAQICRNVGTRSIGLDESRQLRSTMEGRYVSDCRPSRSRTVS